MPGDPGTMNGWNVYANLKSKLLNNFRWSENRASFFLSNTFGSGNYVQNLGLSIKLCYNTINFLTVMINCV